jgi:sterol desaturase/sphingolipid hydroxylase (fatty acid hydroxylase superfamily)
VLIALEWVVAKMQAREVYRFHDSITDLNCGVGSLIVGAATKAVGLGAYTTVWHVSGIFEIEPTWWSWVGVFVAVDFCYYWFHRGAHRINLFWAGHVVHHQSEDYNLAVALRQSWYLPLVEWLFYAPLAVLGVNPLMYITAKTFNTLYQFWIHTEVVERVGPLEWVLNTPSHHRVHHGKNPEYIDKNYGGILIVWDRLFGTWEPEVKEPVYGTITPVASWNALWVNLEHWKTIVERVWQGPTMKDRFYAVFGPPGWRPGTGELAAPQVSRETQKKYDTPTSTGLDVYVGVNFLLAGAATTAFMAYEKTLPPAQLAACGAAILLGVIAWGGLFEGRRWAMVTEVLRWLTLPAVAFWLSGGHPGFTAIAAGASVVGTLALVAILRITPRVAASMATAEVGLSQETTS